MLTCKDVCKNKVRSFIANISSQCNTCMTDIHLNYIHMQNYRTKQPVPIVKTESISAVWENKHCEI